MAHEPNAFVNPNQRGVDLPAGCVNLHELLQKMAAQKRKARTMFPLERGSLKDIPRHVQALYMGNYGMSLFVMIRAVDALLWVQNRDSGSRLSFLLKKHHTGLAPVIQDFSGKVGFHEETMKGVKQVTIPLPHLWLEAAQIVEEAIRGYGASQNTDLLFYFVWREE